MLSLAEQHRAHLGAQLVGIIVGVEQCLEALHALSRPEELLVRLHDLTDTVGGEPEFLLHQRGPVRSEYPVGQFQVEQPVADSRRHGTRTVDEEFRLGLQVQQPVLDRVLVVGDTHNLDALQPERVQVGGVLALRVVPEHHPVRLEATLQVRPDRGCRHSSLASRPGIFFSAAPNFG